MYSSGTDSECGTCTWQGRFSFIGAQPALEVIARGETVTVLDHTNQRRQARTPCCVPARHLYHPVGVLVGIWVFHGPP